MIILFSGSSGVGKNTIIAELLKRNSNFVLMPTITTRSPRAGEKEGNPYFFVTKNEFEEQISKDEFYEYEIVHGKDYYGTSKKIVNSLDGSSIALKDVDVLGAINLKQILEGEKEITTIYLTIDKEVLKERLIGRDETITSIKKRLERYDFELSHATQFDFVIKNDSLERTLEVCEAIIKSAKK